MSRDDEEQRELRKLIKQNQTLLEENQRMLKRLHRYIAAGFWMRILWLVVLIGIPFALYFYVLEPYFAAFGGSFDTFLEGMNELPGIKSIDILLDQEGRN